MLRNPDICACHRQITERFTRVGEREIFYEFAVDDPTTYTQPWRAELSFYASEKPVYEYACHEANYAMEGILGGARRLEARAKAGKGAEAKVSAVNVRARK